jgi:hypothetical protein
MFIAALFIMASLCNKTGYSTTNDWKKKMWYLCPVKYLTGNKNETISFAGKWVELEIILSEICQVQKDKYCTFLFILNVDLKQ